jgi:hypothetical protein
MFGPHSKKLPKISTFCANICQKLRKNAQNIGKSQSFDPELGRRNLLLGRGLATPGLDNTDP